MAKIAGITIELGADATGIEKALKGVNSTLKTTQGNLKDINKLLKLDPKNTELLTQKQKNLKDAISQSNEKLKQLREAQKHVKEGTAEWDALQREIIATEQDIKKLEKELKNFGSVTAQKLNAAGQQMKDFGNKVQSVGRELSKVSAVAAGALAALGKVAYGSMQSADELATLSKQTGVSTDTLQKWSYAADLVDVSVSDITGALKKLKKGMGSDAKVFEELGVSTRESNGELRNAEDVFYDTVKALSKIENETERDTKAMEVFGKSADDLAGIIDDGGAALAAYGKEAEDAGLIMSEDMIGTLNDANDSVDKLKANMRMSFAQLGGTLIEKFGPALESVAGFIEQLTEKIRNLTPEQAETIVKVLGIVAVLGPLVTMIGSIITAIGALMTIIPLLMGPVGIVLAVIAVLIAKGIWLYKNWDTIKAKAQELWSNVVAAWNGIKAGVQSATNAVSQWVVDKWNAIKEGVSTAANAVKDVATAAWEGLKSVVGAMVDGIKAKIQGMIDKFNAAKDAVKNCIDKLKSILSGELKFPHIKIPHFNISGGVLPWGIGGQGTPPQISVDWYKKAYENPVLFTSPTVLPTMGGYKGFGDGSGAEIVMSLEKLRELVADNNQPVVVQVALEGDARGLFKAVQKTNLVRTRATNYNALAVAT